MFFDKGKISILVENGVCDLNLKGEWGFSVFIQFDGKNILYDTGQTNVFLENAKSMGIDLDKTDFIVLSHFHNDHTGGIKNTDFADNKTIIAHPRVFREIGDKIQGKYKKIESAKVFEVTENIIFLGEIDRITNFEKGNYGNDKMPDDTAIVLKTKKGLFIITGCSHSGVVNICEYAKKVTGENKIYGLLGGFHLLKMIGKDKVADEQVEKTIEYFEKEKIEKLFPMHCVDFEILSKMHQRLNIKKLASGDKIGIN